MQIHELNNFSGTLGAGSYLAIDNGTDTGRISSQGLLASTEARIDAANDQITDVKSDINIINGTKATIPISGMLIVQGTYNSDGVVVESSTRIRNSGFLAVKKDQRLHFSAGSNIKNIFVGYFSESEEYIRDGEWLPDDSYIDIEANGKLILLFRNGSNSDVTPSDYDAVTTLETPTAIALDNLNKFVNLVGEEAYTAYPVCINKNDIITFSTSNGESLVQNARLFFLDENKQYQYYYTLSSSSRVMEYPKDTPARYLLLDIAPTPKIMVNYGSKPIPYTPYIEKSHDEIESLNSLIDTVVYNVYDEGIHHRIPAIHPYIDVVASATQSFEKLGSTMSTNSHRDIIIDGYFDYDRLPEATSFAGFRLFELDGNGSTLVRNDFDSLPHTIKLNEATASVSLWTFVEYSVESDTKIGLTADIHVIIGNEVKAADSVPSYSVSMLREKCSDIRDNMAEMGRNGESIIFITDTHIPNNTMNSPAMIKYLMENCSLDFVVFGGDVLNRDTTKATVYKRFTDFIGEFTKRGIHLYNVVGNHEYNNPGSSTDPAYLAAQLTDDEIYPFFIKQDEMLVTIDSDSLAYYFDNEAQKTRYIFVPCNYGSGIDQSVIDFTIDTAIGTTPVGYSIITFAHRAVQGLPSDPNHGVAGAFQPIADALDNLVGTNITPICVIAGHSHIDDSVVTAEGIPIILTTTDAYSFEEGSIDRTKGTENEQAFDVIQIDKTNRTIKCVRIGGGSDRTFTY